MFRNGEGTHPSRIVLYGSPKKLFQILVRVEVETSPLHLNRIELDPFRRQPGWTRDLLSTSTLQVTRGTFKNVNKNLENTPVSETCVGNRSPLFFDAPVWRYLEGF